MHYHSVVNTKELLRMFSNAKGVYWNNLAIFKIVIFFCIDNLSFYHYVLNLNYVIQQTSANKQIVHVL